jgi:hypothetical protein
MDCRGSSSIYLGQKEREIKSLLGNPDSIVSKFEHHRYHLYRKLGLQIDFRPRERTVQMLCFFRSAVEGYFQSPAETAEGLAPGTTKAQVTKALGPPDRSGGGEKLPKAYLREWLWYKQGIQFECDRHGVADRMIIFDSQRGFADQLL